MTNSNRTSQIFALSALLIFCLFTSNESLYAQDAEPILAFNTIMKKAVKTQNSIPKSLQRKLKRDAARPGIKT